METPLRHHESSRFSRLVASNYGRVARVALGAALIGGGLTLVPAPAGLFVAGFGLIPIATGLFNLCPIAPVWGGHFLGANYCSSMSTRENSEGKS